MTHRDFYSKLPVIRSFAKLTDPGVYAPLPQGWMLGLADIVQSTGAIASGRYKAVNTAGAAVIAGVLNALGPERGIPYVFSGDGANFAVPPEDAAIARDALSATAAWARDELGLALRVAMVPVSAARAAGWDVCVARFAPSAGVSYAMFSGGGLAFAEQQMKAGAYALEPGPAGARPDLSGLSCRFAEIPAKLGVILSVIVVPAASAPRDAFRDVIEAVLRLAEAGAEARRPVPDLAPPTRWPPAGLDLEARAVRKPGRSLLAARLGVGVRSLAAYAVFATGLRVGGFDPARYRREVVENTDFRKFDDGLRMTLDCTPALADRIEGVLASAEQAGVARFGSFRQMAALMTCFVPAPARGDHIHFIDGAAGGYAAAAQVLKPPGGSARHLPRDGSRM